MTRTDADDLAALLKPGGSPELERATSSYGRFTAMKVQILKLSRENTNVRSLAISLGQKRKATVICQGLLAALEQAITEEPITGVSYKPQSPR